MRQEKLQRLAYSSAAHTQPRSAGVNIISVIDKTLHEQHAFYTYLTLTEQLVVEELDKISKFIKSFSKSFAGLVLGSQTEHDQDSLRSRSSSNEMKNDDRI